MLSTSATSIVTGKHLQNTALVVEPTWSVFTAHASTQPTLGIYG